MDRKENNHDHNGNGFMLGVFLGSIATLLFTTKKGREIVKDMTEQGLEKFSELQDNIDKAVVTEEVEENDYIEPVDRPDQPKEIEKPKLLAKDKKPEKNHSEKEESIQSPKPHRAVKRLFRIKKN
ncbi:MAG TPA: YtxH domain-containing protein [Xanthomonadales bacterium]|nr:YtxH domain-containing protein [Xanthomonadales bacterium]